MNFLNYIYTALFFCIISINANAKDILVNTSIGNTPYIKLVNAVNTAIAGDVVVVDIDVPFTGTDRSILVSKGISIIGANKSGGRYKLIRQAAMGNRNSNNSTLLIIRSNDVKVENIELVVNDRQAYKAIDVGIPSQRTKLFSNLQFINCIFTQANVKDGARGLFFEGSFDNVLVKQCKFNFWFSLVARDCPTLTNFLVTECEFNNGSHQISLDGALLDEEDPLGVGDLVKHENIVIEKSVFTIAKSFNIALAYTNNVTVRDNTQIDGGTEGYSQPIHIEDRSKNILITGNTMKSRQIAVLLFATGKVGHGQGRKFTEEEKQVKGCGNVTIIDNDITVTEEAPAVGVTYLNGYLRLEGNNIIKADKKAILLTKSQPGSSFTINDNTRIKSKLYGEIKNGPDVKKKFYYKSDIAPE